MVLRLAEPEDFELFCSLYNNLENEMLYGNEQNEVCLDNEFNFDDETLNEYSPTFNSKDEFLAICSLLEKMPGVEKDFKFYYKAKKIPRWYLGIFY